MFVAVVDDHPSVCDALVGMFEAEGIGARGFGSGMEFIESGAAPSTVCLIADVQMPGIGGFELLSKVKADRPELPVILMTALREDELAKKAFQSGAAQFHTKPLDIDNLVSEVRRIMRQFESLN